MTQAMWFAWLLRSDVRGHATLADPDAQRDFVAWWLLFAGAGLPGDVVVRTGPGGRRDGAGGGGWRAALAPAAALSLASEIGSASRLSLGAADDDGAYYGWYRVHGPGQFCAAPALPPDALAASETAMPLSPAKGPPASQPAPSWTAIALRGLTPGEAARLPYSSLRCIADWYLAGDGRNCPGPRNRPQTGVWCPARARPHASGGAPGTLIGTPG